MSVEEEVATYASILVWKIPWTEESGRLQSIGWQRLGSSWAHTHTQNRSQCAVTMLPFPSDLLCLTPLVSWLSLCTTDCWGFAASMSSLLICHLPSAWPTAPLWPLESALTCLPTCSGLFSFSHSGLSCSLMVLPLQMILTPLLNHDWAVLCDKVFCYILRSQLCKVTL